MAANYRQSLIFNSSMNQLIYLFRNPHFAGSLNLKYISEEFINGGARYRFNHGISFSSWGEELTITIMPVSNQQVNLDVYSECAMPTQIIDWGKNKEVVDNVINYICYNMNYGNSYNFYQTNQSYNTCFCTNCGERLTNESAFCPKCGKKQ